jgi:hypothetical protein
LFKEVEGGGSNSFDKKCRKDKDTGAMKKTSRTHCPEDDDNPSRVSSSVDKNVKDLKKVKKVVHTFSYNS